MQDVLIIMIFYNIALMLVPIPSGVIIVQIAVISCIVAYIISNFKVEINVTCDNIYQAIEQYDYIIYLYAGRAAFNLNSLTKAYCKMFINRITKNKMIRY